MPIADALAALEVDTLLLGLPDRCLPSEPDEDTGVGALASRGGERLLGWVRALGFTGIQLGPQGDSSATNPSPYDGAAFSRSPLGLAVARLAEPVWGHLLEPAAVAGMVAACPPGPSDRIRYAYAYAAHVDTLAAAHRAFVARRAAEDPGVAGVAERLAAFVARSAWWLEADTFYATLRDRHGGADWPAWPDAVERTLMLPDADGRAARAARRAALASTAADAVERHAFGQLVLHEQHRAARATANALGLEVWGDLPVGLAARDVWSRQHLFLPRHRLGAPPSRTTPAGQPWGYPVLDPSQPAARDAFVAARLGAVFDAYDAVRLDHPHGLVCPWVYRADSGDDGAAVRAGARLFAAPDLSDHPELATFAIARRDQLNPDPATARHADDWVVDLTPAQVDRYGRLIAVILQAARERGRDERTLACEILSTCPYPLARVLERHGLGRFRVTQKVDLNDPLDCYRSEHAEPADWIMAGTHDTPPIWTVVEQWAAAGTLGARADYLSTRLAASPRERDTLARRLAADPGLLVQAIFADLFASRARRVFVFVSDALGIREPYNRPGLVHEENWTLRLPRDVQDRFARRLANHRAMNLPLALAMALRARGAAGGDRADLVRRLDAEAQRWRAGAVR